MKETKKIEFGAESGNWVNSFDDALFINKAKEFNSFTEDQVLNRLEKGEKIKIDTGWNDFIRFQKGESENVFNAHSSREETQSLGNSEEDEDRSFGL